MHDFSFSVYLVKATWEKHGAVQAGIEGAQVINVIVFHLYLTHFTVPDLSSVRYQLVETVFAKLFEIQLRLFGADKGGSNTCVYDFSLFRGESDHGPCVVSFCFCFIRKNVVFENCGNECERFVELNHEIVFEVFRHTAAILG